MSHSSSSHIDDDALRELLARWYDGTATTAEEETLIRTFSAPDAGSLPPDLAEERMIFAAMAAPEVSDAEAGQAIDQAIRMAESTRKWPRFRRRFLRVAAAACIAATAVTLSVGLWRGESASGLIEGPALTASLPAPQSAGRPETPAIRENVTPASAANQAAPAAPAGQIAKTKASAPPRAIANATPILAETDPENFGYREPTPEEAEAILMTLNHAGREMTDCAEEVSDYVDSALITLREETERAAEYSEYEELFFLLHNDDK